MTLLFTIRRVDHGPDVFVLFNSEIADMVIMVIQSARSRLNMQVVMAGRLTFVVFSYPQPSLLLQQQFLAFPGPSCLPVSSSRTSFPPPGSPVHVYHSLSYCPFGCEGAHSTRQGRRACRTEAVCSMEKSRGDTEEDHMSASLGVCPCRQLRARE
jgi:hypothetical protein